MVGDDLPEIGDAADLPQQRHVRRTGGEGGDILEAFGNRIGQRDTFGGGTLAAVLVVVPGQHRCPARRQRTGRGEPGTAEPDHGHAATRGNVEINITQGPGGLVMIAKTAAFKFISEISIF